LLDATAAIEAYDNHIITDGAVNSNIDWDGSVLYGIPEFSLQQVLECAGRGTQPLYGGMDYSNDGCSGGDPYLGAWYFKKATGKRLYHDADWTFQSNMVCSDYDYANSSKLWLRDVTLHEVDDYEDIIMLL
jgi:hypothetical protein